MNTYLYEFLTIAGIHAINLATPGIGLALVIQQSTVHNRKAALFTTMGLASGCVVHISAVLLGIGIIVAQSAIIFKCLKVLAAAYLIFQGLKFLFRRESSSLSQLVNATVPIKFTKAFQQGFLASVLSPKPTITYLSIFTIVVSQQTPLIIQAGYGAWIVFANIIWYGMMSLFFSSDGVGKFFKRTKSWIDKTTGLIFITLGMRLFMSKQAPT